MKHLIGGLAFAFLAFFVLPQVGFTPEGEPTWVLWVINGVCIWTLIGAWNVLPRFRKKWPALPVRTRLQISVLWPFYRDWLNKIEEEENKEDET